MINGLSSRKMMFTFDKFAPSNIFHREFCSWNRNFVSYVDFILERRGIRKLDWIVRKGSAVFDRFSFAKTRRQDEWKNRWKFGYCVPCMLTGRFECSFDSLLFIYLHYRFYDTRGNCSERYFDSWDQERMIDTIFLTNLWNYCKTGIHK